MLILRLILFSGLILHKLVWEVLKRGNETDSEQNETKAGFLKTAVKLVKMGVLGFLLIQTLFLNLFPITDKPFSVRLVGIVLYFAGLITAIMGRLHLGDNWANLEDYQVKNDQSLVTRGVYRYIRHPIYSGDILMLFGLQLALNSWLVLAMCGPLLVIAKQAVAEEKLLASVFPDYDAYCQQTKRFIPFLV